MDVIKAEIKILIIIITIHFLLSISGTFIFSYLESWNLFEGFYFTMITMLAIGYGDYVPVTYTGRLLSIFWAYSGIITLLLIVAFIVRIITIRVKAGQAQ